MGSRVAQAVCFQTDVLPAAHSVTSWEGSASVFALSVPPVVAVFALLRVCPQCVHIEAVFLL